jgi:copper(I)-binding protein
MATPSLLAHQRSLAAALAVFALVGQATALQAPIAASHATMRIPKAGFTSTLLFVDLHASRNVRLVGASSPAAASIRVMTMKREGNEVFMQPVSAAEVPAGAGKRLRTGIGEHFLFAEHVRSGLRPGQKVPLTLLLEENGRRVALVVQAEVVAPKSYSAVPEQDVH